MLYPVYVWIGDEKTAHGMAFPDFAGCFSAADNWQDIPLMAQEAVVCHMAGEGWERSQGAHLEMHIAHRIGIDVMQLDALLARDVPQAA